MWPHNREQTSIDSPPHSCPETPPLKNHTQHISIHQVFPEQEILSVLPPYLRIPAVLYAYRTAVPRLPLLCQIEMSFPGFLAMMVRTSDRSFVPFASTTLPKKRHCSVVRWAIPTTTC